MLNELIILISVSVQDLGFDLLRLRFVSMPLLNWESGLQLVARFEVDVTWLIPADMTTVPSFRH